MSNGHGYSRQGFGIDREESANLIVRTALENGVDDPRHIAYMLATAEHETRNFEAPEEDFGISQARKLGYSGGEQFYGRGYVHLTHDYNYKQFDELLGLNGALFDNPDLATNPEIAARILVIGMRDGLFTAKRLDRYIGADGEDVYNARRVVNGITKQEWTVKAAGHCEDLYGEWEKRVPSLVESARSEMERERFDPVRDMRQTVDSIRSGSAVFGEPLTSGRLPEYLRTAESRRRDPLADGALQEGERGPEVMQLQEQLKARAEKEGRRDDMPVDPVYGKQTRRAVENFQLWNDLPITGIADKRTLDALQDPNLASPGPRPDEAADTRPKLVPIERASHSSAGLDSAQVMNTLGPQDPVHPHHGMLQQIREHLRGLDESSGRAFDQRSEQLSHRLLTLARDNGMTRIDHVVHSRAEGRHAAGEDVFVVQGRLNDPAHVRASVNTELAANTPVAESNRQLDAVEQRFGEQQALQPQTMAQSMEQGAPDNPHVRRM